MSTTRHVPAPTFDERKTTQAAARFAQLEGGKISYMKLIKLLYLLDRSALRRLGRPVTGGEYFEMKLGPVISEVLNLVTEEPTPDEISYWSKFFSAPSNYVIALTDDPGDGELSEAETRIIDEIYSAFGNKNQFQLAEYLHKILSEIHEIPIPYGRIPIDMKTVLTAEEKRRLIEPPKSKKDAQKILRRLREREETERLLAAELPSRM